MVMRAPAVNSDRVAAGEGRRTRGRSDAVVPEQQGRADGAPAGIPGGARGPVPHAPWLAHAEDLGVAPGIDLRLRLPRVGSGHRRALSHVPERGPAALP